MTRREEFLGYYERGMSYSEIARICGVSRQRVQAVLANEPYQEITVRLRDGWFATELEELLTGLAGWINAHAQAVERFMAKEKGDVK